MEQPQYTVVPDTHGHYEVVARMVEQEEPHADRFIFMGDVVDGQNPVKLINLILELGDRVVTLSGNHEWVLRNALAYGESQATQVWRTEVWSGYEKNMLTSYNLQRTANWNTNAQNLREAMIEQGHFAWLAQLPPFFETPDFVALHAGPALHQPWHVQRNYLEQAALPENQSHEEPPQFFSSCLSCPQDVPETVDPVRLFITGHTHLFRNVPQRVMQRRVCLASPLSGGDDLFVWRSSENRIITYPQQ